MGLFSFGTPQKGLFKKPSISSEIGEIKRAASALARGNEREFVETFLKQAKVGKLVALESGDLSRLENTDAADINKDDWDAVARNADQVDRDWETIKERFEKRLSVDAPIVVETEDTLHLVAGNTRLMCARAADVPIYVFWVDMTEFGKEEPEEENEEETKEDK